MPDNNCKTVLFLANHYITLYAVRRELIERLAAQGHRVYISVPYDERNGYFESVGCHVVETPMSRHGTNPVDDIALLHRYKKIMRQLKPDVIFSYTIKPNIYGAMAANSLGLKQVCNITGTGGTFMKEGFLSRVARSLYRAALKKAYLVFFQNTGDREYFIKHRMVADNWDMLPGSGVNLKEHFLCDMPQGENVNFIDIGRVLALKGMEQYLDCARYIRGKYPNTRFYIAGFIDEPRYEKMIADCEKDGIVENLGFQKDIGRWIMACHCTILPSLGGEGVPNALLESAATGRACIASRINGSTDVVEEGKTGYLFTPGSSQELIEKVEAFLKLSPEEKREMGIAGRQKVEKEFDREIVIARYMKEV